MGFNQEGGIYTGDTTGGQYEDDLPSQEFNALSRAEEAARNALTAQLAAQAAQTAAELAQAAAEAAQADAEATAEGVALLVAQAEAARDAAIVAKVAAQAAQAAAETAEDNAVIAQNAAASSASSASTSATTATTQAGIATTQATNASNSATTASTQAGIATTAASTATTKASEASTSASQASTSASNAATSATSAGTYASNASTSASAASTSATNAANSATASATSATNASNSATSASTSASTATTKASEASTSATSAASSASAAEAARDQALAAFDNFDDKYLGEKTSNPTVDNDGNALQTGALYFNTTVDEMRVYTGTVWVAAYVSGTGLLIASNNLSDVADVASSRTNLGLGTAATTDSTAYATAAQGAAADTAYTDRLKWDGGATGLVAATGRTSLGLGTAATTDSTAYATAAQGAAADSAVQTITSSDASITVNDTGTTVDIIVSENSPASTLLAQVINETVSTLVKGTIVYINGGSGNKATVTKALATGESTSASTFGMITADISTNSNGYVTLNGVVSGLNTNAYDEGTVLYLSPTTAGTFTSTKPVAPNHMVYVGTVIYQHANQGSIQVRIQNGYELDELHDVSITSVAQNDFLVRNGSNLWVNQTPSTARTSMGLGALATLNTVGTTQIDNNAVTVEKLAAVLDLGSII